MATSTTSQAVTAARDAGLEVGIGRRRRRHAAELRLRDRRTAPSTRSATCGWRRSTHRGTLPVRCRSCSRATRCCSPATRCFRAVPATSLGTSGPASSTIIQSIDHSLFTLAGRHDRAARHGLDTTSDGATASAGMGQIADGERSFVRAAARSRVTSRSLSPRARHTERLAEPLSDEDQCLQSMPDASPHEMHRAHTTCSSRPSCCSFRSGSCS